MLGDTEGQGISWWAHSIWWLLQT